MPVLRKELLKVAVMTTGIGLRQYGKLILTSPLRFFGDATYHTFSRCNCRTGQSHKLSLSNTVGEPPMVRPPVVLNGMDRINSVRRSARPAENTDAASLRKATSGPNIGGRILSAQVLHAHERSCM